MATSDEELTPSAFDPQALVAHHRFVRRLAHGLVGDGDGADELTARALAAAVARRPDTGPGFRVWLERVTRRLFHRERRDRERRERRERIAASREATNDATNDATRPTVDLVAEIELHQQVARAFESLEGSSKSALFLRYFHDRTPTEIAGELSLPLGTVKSRLQRGLQQLRARLDADHHGRREEWLAGMLPWIGGPLVTTKVKLVPIAVAALLVAGATLGVNEVWKRGARGGSPSSPAPAAASAGGVAAKAAEDDRARTPTPAAERTPVAADPAALPFAAGIVVDESGAPLSGVDVVASRLRRDRTGAERIEQEPLRLDHLERDHLATSDTAGRFVVKEPADQLAALLFLRAGCAAAEFSDLAAERARNQELRVVLHAGGRLRGRVVDSERRPIVRALVDLLPSDDGLNYRPERVAAHLSGAPHYLALTGCQRGSSDGAGAFAFASIAPGRFRLSVMGGGYSWTQFESTALADPCELVLTRTALLVDVTDGDTDEPIDAALIATDATSGAVLEQVVPWQPADPDHSVFMPKGRLALHTGFNQPYRATSPWLSEAKEGKAAVKLHVVANGYVGELLAVTLSAKEEPPHLKVALTPAVGSDREPSITGRVTGAGAKATLCAYALVPNWSESYLESRPALLTAPCDGDGAFELFDLPSGRYRLRAEAGGCAPVWRDVEAPASGVVLDLAPSATLEVLVRDHLGQPVAGAAIHAQRSDDKHAWKAKSDANGVATLERLPAATLRVGAFEHLLYDTVDEKVVFPLDAKTLPDDGVVTLKAGETARLELRLVERVAVRLHFERDDGSPVAHAKLELSNFAGPVTAAFQELERLRPLPLAIDSRGDATASLYPGHYSFAASETTAKREVEFDVPRSGEASVTIQLPALGPTGTIAGRLVDLVTRAPIVKRKVFAFLRGDDGKWLDLGLQLSDDDGRFRFDDVPPGAVRLHVEAGSFGDLQRWRDPDPASPYGSARHECTIEANRANEVEIALPPIKVANANLPTVDLDARVTDATTGRPIAKAYVAVSLKIGATSHELFDGQTDAEGRLSAKLYAGESYSLTVFTGAGASGDGAKSSYLSQNLELAPKEGLLRVDVALAKRP